ncbi:MAG TPA: NAD(P)H-hydrate epimerase [Phycisphaerae bacterium]|nr:NAD(P)H-hydrate epimerase [Phycisphaerae bacterium]
MQPTLTFTKAGLAELDRRAVEDFGIPTIALMENAGRAVADAALKLLAPIKQKHAIILAGAGNNGGDGFVAARHLHNAGVHITVLLLAPRDKYKDAAATNLAILERMKLPGGVEVLSPGHAELRDALVEAPPDVLLIDALFGTGLSRKIEGLPSEVIRAMNASHKKILAIDLPSGLDPDTGAPAANGAPEDVIHAAETLSMCGLKSGFPNAQPFTGKILIGDIGAPHELLTACATP